MKNLKSIDCVELTSVESQQISGGSLGLLQDLAYLAAVAAEGLKVFGTEGGRNAGISVR
ncbi:MAG: hypothetical protein KAY27_03500 [Pedobacter sp.]|nr:hypothetical protein [Pedobacter sp.]